MQSNGQPVVSVKRVLTDLLTISSNRSCADCRSTLVDSSQIHASVSPEVQVTASQYNNFRRNHLNFAPPGQTLSRKIPGAEDPPVDPALLASARVGGHGVFVCGLCGAAHKLLGASFAIVHPVQDVSSWTPEEVQRMATSGGNAHSWSVLEAYLPPSWEARRPRPESTVADRLCFVRAKYEALAFVLPSPGPLADNAWARIVNMHPEWKGLWGAELHSPLDLDLGVSPIPRMSFTSPLTVRRAELPDRLVDYFCVATPSEFADPCLLRKDVSLFQSPEDILLVPQITDCYPSPNSHHYAGDFPDHVSTFLFPDGCRPSTLALPPTFFTFVLTSASGDRLYGGVLRIYDEHRDTEFLGTILANTGYTGSLPHWMNGTHCAPANGSMQPSKSSASDLVFLPKCLVVLSHYPFFDLWRKFLLQLYRIALVEAPLPIERFIANFVCEVPLPPPGRTQVKFGFTVKDSWLIRRPPENQLPLADFSFRPLFTALSVSNILVVMGCILQEYRVALLSRHFSILGPVAEALTTLIFPFHWEGMYVPVLPYSMVDILDAPVPFIIGLHSRYLNDVLPENRPRGVVFVDLDRDEVHLGCEEESSFPRCIPCLPERAASKLKTRLEEAAVALYIVPPSGNIGTVTCGNGVLIPFGRRPSYMMASSQKASTTNSRRRDVFFRADKAYRENELQVPITGFLSEHGQFYQREPLETGPQSKRTGKKRMRRSRSRGGSLDSLDTLYEPKNILDLDGPVGFASEEVRFAWLQFFVSIFLHYRQSLDENAFRSEEFVGSLNLGSGSKSFVERLLKTQMFDRFVEERRESSFDPEVRFFDESINAKIKRSKKAAISNIGRQGTKLGTSFLDDESKAIKETFTPPPPSNWGLPDDGRKYCYGSFPQLDPELFGKVRRPRKWTVHQRRRSVARRLSIATQVSEQAVFAKAMAPVVKSGSLLAAATKRGTKNLEHAINALSCQFVETFSGSSQQSRRAPVSMSLLSDVTLPSDLALTPEFISSAEEVVLNSRRKQAILIGLFAKLQSKCSSRPKILLLSYKARVHQTVSSISQPESDRLRTREEFIAACVLQGFCRAVYVRRWYTRVTRASLLAQSITRARRARYAYAMLRTALIAVQSVWRSHIVRQRFRRLCAARLQFYRRHIFRLWARVQAPLCYRTVFWFYLQFGSVLLLGLAETEIRRLWELLDIQPPRFVEEYVDELPANGGCCLNTASCFYWQAIKVDMDLIEGVTVNGCVPYTVTAAAARVLAERVQIYDRLTNIASAPRLMGYFNRLEVLSKAKKKFSLAEAIWTRFDQAGDSTAIMMELFPELSFSSNIYFHEPTKKALRRFRSTSIPEPLEISMWAHKFLETRIHRNVCEVADLAIRKVPTLSQKLTSLDSCSSRGVHFQTIITQARGVSYWPRRRVKLMRDLLGHQV